MKNEICPQVDPFCFFNIYKPKGITSFDVIYKLRKRLKIKKIGHSGTLDPMADGVMQIAVGNTSRLLEYLGSDKEYIAEVCFGWTSTTLDAEGEITKAVEPSFSENELIQVLETFKGKIEQIPPKFSAIKVGGKKLCDLARKNPEAEIEIPARTVEIYSIELLSFKDNKAQIKVNCSKGTYIRTLGRDIAHALGTDAYLTKLTRIKAGNFELKDSIEIESAIPKENSISPIDALELEEYRLSEEEFALVKNGVSIKVELNGKEKIYMLTYAKKLVSIGVLSDNIMKVKKYFNQD